MIEKSSSQNFEDEPRSCSLRRAKEEITELHRKYEELYEFAPAGYVTLSPGGSITRINLNGTTLLGKNREIICRMTFGTFIAPGSLKDYYALFDRAEQSEGQDSAELELRGGEEGSSLWVQCNVQANRDDSGGGSHQIDAIRLIHAQLYSAESITQVRIRSYLRELLETIFAYMSGRRVRIVDEVEDVIFSPRTAVPLGLIVNEIATNAMKYGFTEGEEARFTVELSQGRDGKSYVLKLSNTGAPFPEEVDVEQPTSFGMQLITTLIRQINGSMELVRRPTPQFTITFPAEKNDGEHGE